MLLTFNTYAIVIYEVVKQNFTLKRTRDNILK